MKNNQTAQDALRGYNITKGVHLKNKEWRVEAVKDGKAINGVGKDTQSMFARLFGKSE